MTDLKQEIEQMLDQTERDISPQQETNKQA